MLQPERPVSIEQEPEASAPVAPEHPAAVWVGRITSIVGLICLALALSVWAVRPGHYRFVLALLTIAMFAAVLHAYTFENGG